MKNTIGTKNQLGKQIYCTKRLRKHFRQILLQQYFSLLLTDLKRTIHIQETKIPSPISTAQNSRKQQEEKAAYGHETF